MQPKPLELKDLSPMPQSEWLFSAATSDTDIIVVEIYSWNEPKGILAEIAELTENND